MWFLVGLEQNAGLRIWLKPEMTVTIGRQTAGDVLNLAGEDRSVSRRHVVISVSKPSLSSVKVRGEHTKLTIRDLDSKSGVAVNNTRIEGGKDIEININESHRWTTRDQRHVAGRGYGGWVDVNIGDKTNFRLERVDWSICSVGLNIQSKVGIVEMAAEMDVKVEESWVPGVSTHVVIGNNKVSQRIFLALAEGGYMVDSTWFKEQMRIFQESWETKGQKEARLVELEHPAPTPTGYEDASIQWAPNFSRRTLFKDYRFISLTKPKYQNLAQVIQCAGGTWSQEEPGKAHQLIRECMSMTLIPVFLKPDMDVDMDPVFFNASSVLKKMGYRWVQEVEIGSGLAYASTDMYCNPKYHEELPALVMMSTHASIQVPFSQFVGSAASTQSFVKPAASCAASNVGDAKDSPLLLDEAEETTNGSFDLSQLMAPSKRSAHRYPATAGPDASSPRAQNPSFSHQQTKAGAADKPAKKKAKMDRMALFFDGLDDDDDATVVNPPSNSSNSSAQALPTPAGKATRQSSSLQIPVPVAWPDTSDIDLEQEVFHKRTTRQCSPEKDQVKASGLASETTKHTATISSNSSAGKGKAKLMNTMFEDDEVDETRSNAVKGFNSSSHDELETVAMADRTSGERIKAKIKEEELFSYPVKESDPSSQLSASSTRGVVAAGKKKPTSFDVIRDDMVALNLEVKLERQIQNMEEQERWKRLSAQTKCDSNKVMQWERSAALNTKSKRRKLVEQQQNQQGPGQGSKIAGEPREGSSLIDNEVQILDEADQKDWPERWKKMPNFKNFSGPSLDLQEKWKNVPNFKAFRKSKLPGVKVEPREPLQLTLDGELVPKQEATAKKIATYLKREPEVPDVPVPVPRRKVSEKQREREDLQKLLADD
ncbi:hypothetical protein BG015_010369 [Linnemannia schmuckeri]|uniref:FHA domain-containing protein n=1 Tax=Linnemannia schmuckeri TaxID=64567 RepID=A0A9P5RUK2_9FUNG|nr:hypothetical protein BG015_010369 [Linnemannia schmuckeri]